MQRHQIPLRQYIEEALFSENGYYNTKVAIGAKQDFETFAERWAPIYANRCFYAWQAMLQHGDIKAEQTFYIYEFGAGTGQMAARMLKYLHGRALLLPNSPWQQFYKQLQYVIGEISPRLMMQQRAELRDYLLQGKVRIYKTDARQIDTSIPSGAGVVISNELIDTFPPHELIIDTDTVTATVVNMGETYSPQHLPIDAVLSTEDQDLAQPVIDSCRQLAKQLPHAICVRPDMVRYYEKLQQLLTRGYVFTIDYGFTAYIDAIRENNTLRTYSATYGFDTSYYQHKGELDITGDVNFTHMEHIGRQLGFEFTYFGTQDAIGGVPICDFAILIQRKNVNPACDAILCQGMKKTTPVSFENMSATKIAIAQGLQLLNAVTTADQNAIPSDDPDEFNNVMVELHNRIEDLFIWLLEQDYCNRDREFFIPMNDSFSLIMLKIASTQYTNQVLNKLIENEDYARILLTMISGQIEANINSPDRNIPEYLSYIRDPLLILTYFISKQHPALTQTMLHNQDAINYNLSHRESTTTEPSLLTRCLNAASKDNALRAARFKLFSSIAVTNKSESLVHRFQ